MADGMKVESMFNRRTFLKTGITTGAATLPLAAAIGTFGQESESADATAASAKLAAPKLMTLPARLAQVDPTKEPWQLRVRRVGQSNMTEHDPAVMNIEEWADYWHGCGTDIVYISVTGILAFYPSKVKFHRHG